jgi:hypothetical protein
VIAGDFDEVPRAPNAPPSGWPKHCGPRILLISTAPTDILPGEFPWLKTKHRRQHQKRPKSK